MKNKQQTYKQVKAGLSNIRPGGWIRPARRSKPARQKFDYACVITPKSEKIQEMSAADA